MSIPSQHTQEALTNSLLAGLILYKAMFKPSPAPTAWSIAVLLIAALVLLWQLSVLARSMAQER